MWGDTLTRPFRVVDLHSDGPCCAPCSTTPVDVHRYPHGLRSPRAPFEDVLLVSASHLPDPHRNPMEHLVIVSLLPLLVLGGWVRDLPRGLHLSPIRRRVPAILYHIWASHCIDGSFRNHRIVPVHQFFLVRPYIVSQPFCCIHVVSQ
jgi:hypothetical protein